VVLQVEIDRQGNVTDAKVVSGHRALVASAIDAVKQWKYHPYMINGEPFPMQTKVEVPFTLPK
jgi:protein TonB